MNKIAIILAVFAMMGSAPAFAETRPTNGRGASAATAASTGDNGFAWAIALGGLAVIATVVGLAASSASSSGN